MPRNNFDRSRNLKDLFISNYIWWNTKGSLAKDNPFSYYDRDEIISENNYDSNIIKLNKYIITNDSQCGLVENHYSSYDESALFQRSKALGVSIEDLRNSKVKVLQKAYVSGWMLPKNAEILFEVLDQFKTNFTYFMCFSRKDFITSREVEDEKKYLPLTTEIIKLPWGDEIEHYVTNVPPKKTMLDFYKLQQKEIGSQIPHLSDEVNKLVEVEFVMNEYGEEDMVKQLVAILNRLAQ